MINKSIKLIILDRDGVINYDSPDYIKSPEEWHPIPGSLEAIAQLNRAGFAVVIATNQSGVGRGYFSLSTLQAIHQKMHDALSDCGGKIDKIYFCPHEPETHCDCRKPKAGLFDQIAKDYAVDWSHVYCVGDSVRDMQIGLSFGCKNILVLTGNGKQTLNAELNWQAIKVCDDLAAAANWIIANQK